MACTWPNFEFPWLGAKGASGGAALGAVMKIVQPAVKGRADGGFVAATVKSAIGMS
ncbi:MAG: hypothetical protein F2923_03750 [Actinobacteria bacterium]|nr:hypothetical protein [Actinomycetota bacterium]MTB27737.1 hypothetical protein [Actinomycetota bacterium]